MLAASSPRRLLGRLFAQGVAEGGWFTAELPPSQAQLAALVDDGELSLRIVPSARVDDFGASELSLTLEYLSEAQVPDYARLVLMEGQLATMALAALTDGVLRLDLYDAGGTLLAAGVPDATDLGWVIDGFVAPATGEYFVRVAGADTTAYSLLVARGAQLSIEPHDTFESAQDITSTGLVMGIAGFDMGRLFVANTAPGHNEILELDPQTCEVIRTHAPVIGPITGLATTPTTLLVASMADGVVYELDRDDGTILRELDLPSLNVVSLAFFGAEIFARSDGRLDGLAEHGDAL